MLAFPMSFPGPSPLGVFPSLMSTFYEVYMIVFIEAVTDGERSSLAKEIIDATDIEHSIVIRGGSEYYHLEFSNTADFTKKWDKTSQRLFERARDSQIDGQDTVKHTWKQIKGTNDGTE